MEDRQQLVKEELSGGTMPEHYFQDLVKFAANSPLLDLEVVPEIATVVSRTADTTKLDIDGKVFDMVILCTGVTISPLNQPLYKKIHQDFDAPVVRDFPQLDTVLRWKANEDIFVLGCNAMLEIGPGCLNMMGAMRGARLVAEELHDLIWRLKPGSKGKLAQNLFAALDDSSDGSDSTSSDSEEEDKDEDKTEAQPYVRPVRTNFSKEHTAKLKRKKKKSGRGRGRNG